MFKITSLPFLKAMNLVQGAAADRMFVGAASVAATIAECLDLPTSALQEIDSYYEQHFGMTVRDQISLFNEAATIDTMRCLELTAKFWMFRYNVLYGTAPYIGVKDDFFLGYLQCSSQFSPEEMELLNHYALDIALLQNQIRLMIDRAAIKPTASVVRSDASPITDKTTIIY